MFLTISCFLTFLFSDDTSLTHLSYDGEADDPAPPVKDEPVPSIPEPMEKPSVQQEETFKPEDTEDLKVEPEPDQGDGGFHGFQNGQQSHNDDYDRPIGIKEDGYV